jgi:Flp pilus assembly pilin Flp
MMVDANRILEPITKRLSPQAIRRDEKGQDLIEYALLCGFMVIAVYVILPSDLMPAVSRIFSRILGLASTLTGS